MPPPTFYKGFLWLLWLFVRYWCWCLISGGDGGAGNGRVLRRSECGGCGEGFCKVGYFIDVGGLYFSVFCVMVVVVLVRL